MNIETRSQLILNKGVTEKLLQWQKERVLTDEELTYLWLAQLTVARIEGREDREEPDSARDAK